MSCISALAVSVLVHAAQVKDKWGFQMTARYDMYAEFFNEFVQPNFKPQVIRDPALPVTPGAAKHQ